VPKKPGSRLRRIGSAFYCPDRRQSSIACVIGLSFFSVLNSGQSNNLYVSGLHPQAAVAFLFASSHANEFIKGIVY
jgi:hypothetical protein